MSVLKLKVNFSKNVFFIQTKILKGISVGLFRHLVLDLLKLILVNLKLLFD